MQFKGKDIGMETYGEENGRRMKYRDGGLRKIGLVRHKKVQRF